MKRLAFVCLLIPVAAAAQTITSRVGGILANGVTGGVQGLVLKQVGGGALAQQQATYTFDPAGASGVLPLLYAMLNAQTGALSLDTQISHYTNPASGCPNPPAVGGTEPLRTALQEMMWNSDNARAFEVQSFFDRRNLDAFSSKSLGLKTTMPQTPGCHTPSISTLSDLVSLYEVSINGQALGAMRDTFKGLLAGKAQAPTVGASDYAHIWDTDIPNMIRQEAPSWMTETQMTVYRNSMDLGYKTGETYTCQNTECTQALEDLSIAGWARVPYCSGGQTVTRDFVFGAFLSGAPDMSWSAGKQTAAQKAFAAGRAELLREQIHDGLASCYGGDAVLVVPAPGSALTGRTATFSWSAAPAATGYRLDVGRSAGGSELGTIFTSGTSALFTNLPCDGSILYARLWSRFEFYTNPKDYQFRACSNGGPVITSPTPGTAFSSSSVTFTWSAISNADSYRLTVGTTLGGSEIDLVMGTTTSATVNNIPRDKIVYASIAAHAGTAWTTPNDYAYNNLIGQGPVVASVATAVTAHTTLSPAAVAVLTGSNFGADAIVRIDGTRAQVIGTPGGTQITFIVPPTLTAPRISSLVLTSGAASSAAFPVTLAAASPGLYSPLLDDSGAALAVSKTLKAGDVAIARASGIGGLNTSGQPSLTIRVLVSGMQASIVSTQPSADSPGVTNIAFRIPTGVRSGAIPVVVEAAGIASNSVNLTIAGPAVSGVVNAATFTNKSGIAPGSIVSLFGTDLSVEDKLGLFPSTQLPGGGVVTVNGVSAPIFDVAGSGTQINLLVPFETPADGSVPVVVANGKGTSTAFQLPVASVSPGIFIIPDPVVRLRKQAAALLANTAWRVMGTAMADSLGMPYDCRANHVDVRTICGEPAGIGDTIQIYVTGLGRATPNGNPVGNTLRTGDVAPADGSVLYKTVETPRVTIDGIDAPVLFSGIAPGYAGLYQINVTIPGGINANDIVPVTITIGGQSDSATIAVRP